MRERVLGSSSAEQPKLKTSPFNDLTLLRTVGNHSGWATEQLRGLKGNICVQAAPRTTGGWAPNPLEWMHVSIRVFSKWSPVYHHQYLLKSAGFNSHRASAPCWQLQQPQDCFTAWRFHKIHNSEYQKSKNRNFPSQFSALTCMQRVCQTQHRFLPV